MKEFYVVDKDGEILFLETLENQPKNSLIVFAKITGENMSIQKWKVVV